MIPSTESHVGMLSQRKQVARQILIVPDKPLRVFHSAFHSAKAVHHVMEWPEVRFRMLAGVKEACRTLAALSLSDIDVVRGMKDLRLRALIDFVVVQREFSAARQPGVVCQQRRCPVIGMSVDWPMSEHKIGMRAFQNLPEICVAGSIHFRVAIDLPRE